MITPGDVLSVYLASNKWDNGDLCAAACINGNSPLFSDIACIYRGVPGVKITEKIAEIFGQFFENKEFWLHVQKEYDDGASRISALESALSEIKEFAPANMYPQDAVDYVVDIVDEALK